MDSRTGDKSHRTVENPRHGRYAELTATFVFALPEILRSPQGQTQEAVIVLSERSQSVSGAGTVGKYRKPYPLYTLYSRYLPHRVIKTMIADSLSAPDRTGLFTKAIAY